MNDAESMYVSKWYVMDPQFEDLVFGDDLREGMIVLLEDSMFRTDLAHIVSGYDQDRADECNRWCEVTQLRVISRTDEHGRPSSPLIRFIGRYGDGTKRVRQFDASFAWVVKLGSGDAGAAA